MKIKKLLERLERIKDSLADSTNRYEIEGTLNDLSILIDDIDSFGVEDDEPKPDIDLDVSAEYQMSKNY